MRLRAAGLLMGAAFALAGTARAAGVADGQRAYDSGRFIEAMRDWMPLAEAGDRDAAFGLGLLYDLGSGVAPDPGAALRWYQRAADAGLPAAEFNVAVLYDSGHGVARNSELAASWYARAAAHGHLRAAYDLGQLYEDGDGVPRNLGLAAAWFARAAPNLAAAATRLAALKPALAAQRADAPHPVQPPPAPVLMVPEDGARLGARPAYGSRPAEVELVWSAPESPLATRFFVELRNLDADASSQPMAAGVFQSYVDVSAVVVPLPPGDGRYAWRVYGVTDSPPHYAVGAWRYFSVGANDGLAGVARAGSERLDDHHDHDH